MQIHTRFHEPRATRENHKKSARFQLPDYHGLRSSFPTDSPIPHLYHFTTPRRRNHAAPTTPNMQRPTAITHTRFNLIRFRSPLLTEYLFLRVLRCFTSPRHPQPPYTFRWRYPETTPGRFPHSDTLGSQLVCQLPEAYRRLQRPSSAPCTKASTERP